MKPEDCEEEIELWAVNAQSFSIFEAMGTQWRTGMSGATGLDYQALPVVMDMLSLDPEMKQEVFRDLRVMEREALNTMADNRED